MGIFAILLCDFSGVYAGWVCLFTMDLNDEIFGSFFDVLSGFLQVK